MNWFLRIKHWQLFLILAITAFWNSPSPLKETVNLLSLVVLLIWINAIATKANGKLANSYRQSLELLRLNSFFMVFGIGSLLAADSATGNLLLTTVTTLIAVLVCIVIVVNAFFVSRMLIAIEAKDDASKPSNLYFYMLGFLLPMIGVWFIQPRINRFFSEEKLNNE